MKELIISVMIIACVSCASKPIPIPPTPVIVEDPLVPLTAELFSRLQTQVKNDGFVQLQFFISGPFILENYSTDKESLSVAGDKIIINGWPHAFSSPPSILYVSVPAFVRTPFASYLAARSPSAAGLNVLPLLAASGSDAACADSGSASRL